MTAPPRPQALPFRLLLITDWTLGRGPLLERIAAALTAGPGIAVQHRHPDQTDRAFYEEGLALAEVCARHRAPLFVNGRIDLALALGAHLHLPSRALRVADARPHLNARWISVAVHDAAEAQAAEGADLALVSPVFSPGSKPLDTRPFLGAEGLRDLTARLGCPAFALGGLTPERARDLAPLAGVAVISAVLRAPTPARAALEFLSPAQDLRPPDGRGGSPPRDLRGARRRGEEDG